jgi:hypothetical protein
MTETEHPNHTPSSPFTSVLMRANVSGYPSMLQRRQRHGSQVTVGAGTGDRSLIGPDTPCRTTPNESRKTASPIDTISGNRSLTPPNLEERARHFLDKLLEESELGARELWNQERGESPGSHSKPYETCQRLARGTNKQRHNSP